MTHENMLMVAKLKKRLARLEQLAKDASCYKSMYKYLKQANAIKLKLKEYEK